MIKVNDFTIYPCTVIADRYGGCYSGGVWTAFPCDPECVPEDPQGGDGDAAGFWDGKVLAGVADTPDEAVAALIKMLNETPGGMNGFDYSEARKCFIKKETPDATP